MRSVWNNKVLPALIPLLPPFLSPSLHFLYSLCIILLLVPNSQVSNHSISVIELQAGAIMNYLRTGWHGYQSIRTAGWSIRKGTRHEQDAAVPGRGAEHQVWFWLPFIIIIFFWTEWESQKLKCNSPTPVVCCLLHHIIMEQTAFFFVFKVLFFSVTRCLKQKLPHVKACPSTIYFLSSYQRI